MAGDVDLVAHCLYQRDVQKFMLHASAFTADDAPALVSASDDEPKAVGRIGAPLAHSLPLQV